MDGIDEHFSPGEQLIVRMLCDLFQSLKVQSLFDPAFVRDCVDSGHYWALRWQYAGFADAPDAPADIGETSGILGMWRVLEESVRALPAPEQVRVIAASGWPERSVEFLGFDRDHEPHHGIAVVLIDKMGYYPEFKGRALDAHHPAISVHRRLHKKWQVLSSSRTSSWPLAAQELVSVLKT